ncbi:MAG: hypothetical protein ACRCT2_00750, partial [Plesiomonas shigelloides]
MPKVLTVAEIRDTFPIEITPIGGRPTATSLRAFFERLYSNAASIPSTLGGAQVGSLGLVLEPVLYDISYPAFVYPANPGPTPTYPENATSAQLKAIKEEHAVNLAIYQLTFNTDQALNQYIVASVDKSYLLPMRDKYTGFASRKAMELVTHLKRVYGPTTPQDFAENFKKLSEPWDPASTIEELAGKMDDVASYAELGNKPIAESQIIDAMYTLLYNSGLYFEALVEWDNKPDDERTWSAFKEYTVQAQTKLFRQQAVTTASRGYANHAQQLPPPPVGYVLPPPPPYTQQLQTDAASLAGTHISQLTTAMTEHYANFANSVQTKLEAQIQTLEKRLASHQPTPGGQQTKRART